MPRIRTRITVHGTEYEQRLDRLIRDMRTLKRRVRREEALAPFIALPVFSDIQTALDMAKERAPDAKEN